MMNRTNQTSMIKQSKANLLTSTTSFLSSVLPAGSPIAELAAGAVLVKGVRWVAPPGEGLLTGVLHMKDSSGADMAGCRDILPAGLNRTEPNHPQQHCMFLGSI
jgi:Flp pilus assembly protein TadG